MIIEVRFEDRVTLRQHCVLCHTERELDADGLVLGAQHGVHIGHDVIVMPPCGHCGGVETLNRDPGHIPAHAVTPHRLVVNTVADYLKYTGRTHPACSDAYTREAPRCMITGSFSPGSILKAPAPVEEVA